MKESKKDTESLLDAEDKQHVSAGLAIDLRDIAEALRITNKKLVSALKIANKELAFQNKEKEKWVTELNKAKNLYAFIGQVNQYIRNTKDEKALFENACRIAIEFGKFKIAWIGMFGNGNTTITNVAQIGIPDADIKKFIDVPLQAGGPQVYVLHNSKQYICNDILNDPELESWKSLAISQGVCSCMILPIKKTDTIVGTLNLYAADCDFFQKEEIELMLEITRDISFALDLFEKERVHERTQELVITNESRFKALIEKSTDMLSVTTREGEVLYASPSIKKLLGYSFEELKNQSALDFIHPDDIAAFIKNRTEVSQTPGLSLMSQQRLKHKNGNWIWCEGTDNNLLDEPGVNAMVSNFRDITERKIMEQQLEFDGNNLAALINNTNDLMWSVDRDGRLITFNQPFNDVIKLMSGKELTQGDNVFSAVLSPQQFDRFKIFYARAFSGESFTEIEYIKAPIESWSEISYCPILKGDEVIGTACHSRNITEKRQAEEELQLTQFAVDNSGDSVFWMKPDASIIKANDAACAMLGYSRQEMEQLSVPDIDPYFNTKTWKVHYEELRQKGSLFFETIQQTKDGRLIPVEIRANYIKFGDEEFNCAFCRDISERKIAEGNLVKSETNLKEAQALAHVGNFEMDLSDYSEVWSDEMYKLLGIINGEAVSSMELFFSFIHPDDVAELRKGFEKCIKTAQNSSFDFRFKGKDGMVRYGCTVVKFEFDKNYKPIRLFGIFQDVTESKTAEIERIKMVNDLMLRNKELEQFAYIISHNLRAPVANIIGASSVLNDPGLSIEDKEVLNKGISVSITRLDDVVQDLNHILQVKGEINDNKEVIRFSDMVDDIKTSINYQVEKEDIAIKYDFSEINELLTLKPYLYSVFYNLISNSVKYRRPDVKTVIKIESRLVNNKLELLFEDNGLGIDLKKNGGDVFGLYKRFHSNIEGKGMGLFMVKTQVETLGGKISLQSTENECTEFKIEFEL